MGGLTNKKKHTSTDRPADGPEYGKKKKREEGVDQQGMKKANGKPRDKRHAQVEPNRQQQRREADEAAHRPAHNRANIRARAPPILPARIILRRRERHVRRNDTRARREHARDGHQRLRDLAVVERRLRRGREGRRRYAAGHSGERNCVGKGDGRGRNATGGGSRGVLSERDGEEGAQRGDARVEEDGHGSERQRRAGESSEGAWWRTYIRTRGRELDEKKTRR